jgi:hypothetical protein
MEFYHTNLELLIILWRIYCTKEKEKFLFNSRNHFWRSDSSISFSSFVIISNFDSKYLPIYFAKKFLWETATNEYEVQSSSIFSYFSFRNFWNERHKNIKILKSLKVNQCNVCLELKYMKRISKSKNNIIRAAAKYNKLHSLAK